MIKYTVLYISTVISRDSVNENKTYKYPQYLACIPGQQTFISWEKESVVGQHSPRKRSQSRGYPAIAGSGP